MVSNAQAAENLVDADLVEKIWRILINWSIQREAEIIRESELNFLKFKVT